MLTDQCREMVRTFSGFFFYFQVEFIIVLLNRYSIYTLSLTILYWKAEFVCIIFKMLLNGS